MAHYALLDENNIVTQVVVGVDDDQETELSTIYDCTVKRTSYNTKNNLHTKGGTPFRANYAGIGYTYDEVNDVFIPEEYEWNSTHNKVLKPKPYSTWVIDETTWEWKAPVDAPADAMEVAYEYNNDTEVWDKV
tara:strand:+ start:1518 stop:1916 length:399 start_codon:yes stop_codon:yes gene_type:complete